MPAGVGAVRTCKRVVTLLTGVAAVRTLACKRVEALTRSHRFWLGDEAAIFRGPPGPVGARQRRRRAQRWASNGAAGPSGGAAGPSDGAAGPSDGDK